MTKGFGEALLEGCRAHEHAFASYCVVPLLRGIIYGVVCHEKLCETSNVKCCSKLGKAGSWHNEGPCQISLKQVIAPTIPSGECYYRHLMGEILY